MDISVTIDKNENNVVDLTIAVPNVELERRKDAFFNDLRDKIALPGFRKGHVPKAILEKRFGPQATAESLDDVLKEAIQEAFVQHDIHPVDAPKVSNLQNDNGRIVFKVNVAVRPAIKISDEQILKIPLPKPSGVDVTEDDVTAAIDNERKSTSTFAPILEVRPAQKGDFIVIDYEGFLKESDKPIEGGKAEGAMIEIGAGRFLPGFEEQIIGMNPGDKRRLDVAFPADFYDEDLKGKPAYFHVTVHAIKKRQMVEATDAWAKEHGYESLSDMRAKIRAEMEKGSKEIAKEELRRELFRIINERVAFEPPEQFVQRQAESLMKGLERQYKGGREELLKRLSEDGKTETDLEADVRERARRQVKNSLILDAVAKQKNIQVTEEDIHARLDQMAAEAGTTCDAVQAELEKQDRLDDLRYALLDEKVVQFLIDHADIR